MNNIIITFSGKAHAGKDLCADLMTSYLLNKDIRVFRLAYGDYLKTLATRNFGYNDKDKETGREILQTFGTDIVRKSDPIFWIETVFNTIDTLKDFYDVFIVSDARFDNELQPYPWNMGYPIFNIYIDRKDITDVDTERQSHSSEDMANNPDLSKFHFIIENNGTIDDLYKETSIIIDYIFNKRDEYISEMTKNNQEG